MALHVTQCPSCESTFNTSARLLNAAHGLVRCGACLSVFEATENFVNALPPASNDAAGDENESVFISGQEDYFDPASFLHRSELLIEDDPDPESDQQAVDSPAEVIESNEELLADEFSSPGDSSEESDWHFTELPPDTADAFDLDLNPQQPKSAESGLEYDEGTELNIAAENQPDIVIDFASEFSIEETFSELSEIEAAIDDDALPSAFSQLDPDHTGTDYATGDKTQILVPDTNLDSLSLDAAQDLIIDEAVHADVNASSYENIEIPVHENLAFLGDADQSSDIQEQAEGGFIDVVAEGASPGLNLAENIQHPEDLKSHQQTQETESKEALRARLSSDELLDADSELASLSQENLAAIVSVDQSLELEQQKPTPNVKRSVFLSVAGVLFMAVLAGQYFWLQRSILSVDLRYRSGYEFACRLFNCELPPIQDLANIQTENLVIRSHPEVANSLQLTAVFRNVASFQQLFPIIEVSFTDLDGQPVVSREFIPSEYLPVALQTITHMPVGSPVQITLEFVDPGETAVNYSLDFRPYPSP